MNQQFYNLVYKGWTPKPLTNSKYKLYSSTKLVINALLAMDDSIEVGDFVTYKNPLPDEVWETGDPLIFKVIEKNGDRAFLEAVTHGLTINPTRISLVESLKRIPYEIS